MIRRRAFTSRVVAAAVAGPGCVPQRHSTVPLRTDALWYDPSPQTRGGMLADVALQRGAQAFATERAQQKRRSPARLTLSWSASVADRPSRLLAGGKGVVACGKDKCHFVDLRGRSIGEASRARGGLVLDATGQRLLCVGAGSDAPVVHDVGSGRGLGSLPWPEGETAWQFVRWGSLYLLTSLEAPDMRSGNEPTAGALLTFVPTLRPRQRRWPVGTRAVGYLQTGKAAKVMADASPHGLVLATSSGVQWVDWALRPGQDWRRTIDPLGVAMDDDGAVVLVANIDRAPHLIVVDPNGEVRSDVPLAQATEFPEPPLLGPDGVVALAPKGEIIAYDRDGNVRWHFSRDGASAPVALGDGGMLVEHARQLWVTDWAGAAHAVANLPGPLTAAPVVHEGAWYVATASAVHRFD